MQLNKIIKLALPLIVCISFLSSCSSGNKIKLDKSLSLYNEAIEYMQKDRSHLAKSGFEKIINFYPMSKYAYQARLELSFIYITIGKYLDAISLLEEFEQMYPDNSHQDFVLYMKGIANFKENKMTAEDYIFTDIAQRDRSSEKKAFENFAQLILLYPKSIYAYNAKKRMEYIRNNLAKQELFIAKFYRNKKAYLACMNRSLAVINNFASSSEIKKAASILYFCARKSGMDKVARKAIMLKKQLKTQKIL
jgi:outer membrane protein assembly factor BamD